MAKFNPEDATKSTGEFPTPDNEQANVNHADTVDEDNHVVSTGEFPTPKAVTVNFDGTTEEVTDDDQAPKKTTAKADVSTKVISTPDNK